MIEAHIITLPKSKYSMDLAKRCISNLKDKLNIDGNLFNGTDRYSVWQKYIDSNLNLKIDKFGVGMIDSEIATFFSHLNSLNVLDFPAFLFNDIRLFPV